MAGIAGAMAAIEARLIAGWSTTGIAFENDAPPAVVDENGELIPWVFCEIVNDRADIEGFGLPRNNVIRETGIIDVGVFVPAGSGRGLARQYAAEIGELFRTSKFYDSEPNTYVRTWTPTVGHGQAAMTDSPTGNWWCVPVRIPFEFYHRA